MIIGRNMKKTFIGMVLFSLISALIFAAPSLEIEKIEKIQKVVQINQEDNDKTLVLKLRQKLILILFENPTTGYQWSIDAYCPRILEITDLDYLPDNQNELSVTGSGGKRIFNFSTKRAGETKLIIELRRPWEDPDAPAKTFSVTIKVVKD
ncbi:MAG: protease inhibitor I42 family protein [Candidatus Riflebacteria bacterium]|nr:protease inhibitor I42 family protein [Candidatus Riflebacteria bacterium]